MVNVIQMEDKSTAHLIYFPVYLAPARAPLLAPPPFSDIFGREAGGGHRLGEIPWFKTPQGLLPKSLGMTNFSSGGAMGAGGACNEAQPGSS